MMKRNDRMRFLSLVLVMMLLISSAAFGEKSDVKAASMWLVKTEGTVAVTDDAGEAVSLLDRLGLFSGYGVNTEAASYGWIDLDETKLTKMDENSDVTVEKDGKKLTLTVNSGGLFFNVTEPLADDETMEIRTSTMVTGIRGTMGWVTQDTVCLLEGTVTVTAGDQRVIIRAGSMACLSEDGKLNVRPLTDEDIPAYVAAELDGEGPATGSPGGNEATQEAVDEADLSEGASDIMTVQGTIIWNMDVYGETFVQYSEQYMDDPDVNFSIVSLGVRFAPPISATIDGESVSIQEAALYLSSSDIDMSQVYDSETGSLRPGPLVGPTLEMTGYFSRDQINTQELNGPTQGEDGMTWYTYRPNGDYCFELLSCSMP